jgi:hypothetical protein
MDQLGLYPLLSSIVTEGPLPTTFTNTTLHEFENALARLTALMYWAGIQIHFQSLVCCSDQASKAINVQPNTWLNNMTGLPAASHVSVLHSSVAVSATVTQLNVCDLSSLHDQTLFICEFRLILQINDWSVSDMLIYNHKIQIICLDIQLAVGFGTSITLLILTIVMMLRFPGDYKAGIDAIGILPSMWMAYKHPQLESQFLEVQNPTTNNLRAMGLVEDLKCSWQIGNFLPFQDQHIQDLKW